MAKRRQLICRYCERDIELLGPSWVDVNTALAFCRKLTIQEMSDPAAVVAPLHEPFRSEGPPT